MSLQKHLVRSRKPYGQFYYICYVPKDLVSFLGTKVFRVSLKNSKYSHSKKVSDKTLETEMTDPQTRGRVEESEDGDSLKFKFITEFNFSIQRVKDSDE